ncbi:unnamed protein product [Linum tenue]|uniref:Acid phosphatase 1 n=1 Tax=Linum tenue TaxID=586396 RepID=A0AAV0KNJ2_9ROSI|nr:unnamed protein product [Linum tenue]
MCLSSQPFHFSISFHSSQYIILLYVQRQSSSKMAASSAAVLVRYCLLLLCAAAAAVAQEVVVPPPHDEDSDTVLQSSSSSNYCLSWRLGAETNNVRGWWTVPAQCCGYIQAYMAGSGQYQRDVDLIVDQIMGHASNVAASIATGAAGDEGGGGDDGLDAWVLDVDDTCLSNMLYYKTRRSYGCLPYEPLSFRAWASKARSPAIPAVLGLFNYLRDAGFKVFLVTGRDAEALGDATRLNLLRQGFVGYHRLILRTASYRGQSGEVYKSEMRRQVMDEGYRIWGNVGDQWSDLLGHSLGNRTFKLPNPMYFVP